MSSELLEWIEADELLREDITSWWRWQHKDPTLEVEDFVHAYNIICRKPPFRSLVRYRGKMFGIDEELWPKKGATDLHIPAKQEIGGGCRIQHGHSTWIFAKKIGRDFYVNQNVTIGNINSNRPTIGDRVRISTGAVVVGGITIGDDVTIAPNAFVNFDVPAGKTVFPARSVIVG